MITNRFTLSEDFDWHKRDSGFRWTAGSVTSLDLMQSMEFKLAIPIVSGWHAAVTYNKETDVPAHLSIMRLAVRHRWRNGLYALGGGTIVANKADIDLMIGGGWRSTSGAPGELSVTLAALDFGNNYVYDVLKVETADTAFIYERFPYVVQGTAEFQLAGRLRFEGHAALHFPSTIRAFAQANPDSGFRQRENFSYTGGLLEYSPSSWATVGAMITYVTARIERSQLALSSPDDDLTRRESETWAGAFILLRPVSFLAFEGWLARNWRPEELQATSGSPRSNIDYEDRAWSGMATLTYGKTNGFTADIGLVFDLREVIRGEGQVPALHSIGVSNTRLRLDVGWRLDRRAYVYIGSALDLDEGILFYKRGPPDGYRARLVLHF